MVRPSTFLWAAALVLPLGGQARADFVGGFTGHTLMANQPGSDAMVNLAVYRVTDADFRDDPAFALGDALGDWLGDALGGASLFNAFAPGVGSGGLDLAAAYVYLFQVTNANVRPVQAEGAIRSLRVPWGGGFTSWGVLRDMVFTDAAGHVTHSNSLGNCPEPTEADVAGDRSPSSPTFGSADDPGFAHVPMFPTAERVKNANTVTHAGDFLTALWDPTLGNGIPTASGPRSSGLVAATSRGNGMLYGAGGVQGIIGGVPQNDSHGDIPHPSPEPAALLLAGISLPGLLLVRRRRRAAAA